MTTTAGRTAAQKAFAKRRTQFKDAPSFDNSRLVAGSPMYFRCSACGDPQGICVPESYLTKPDLCDACARMKQLGWLA